MEECYLKPLSRRWHIPEKAKPAAIALEDKSTTMNLEMSELKSESESIGSPVSFFSRDSNMSISSSPENYLDGDSVATSGSLGGRDATGDEANIKPDQVRPVRHYQAAVAIVNVVDPFSVSCCGHIQYSISLLAYQNKPVF